MSEAPESLCIELDDCWNRIGVWSRESASCPELERFTHCRNCNRYSAAGRQMLERKVPDDYRQEWTERFSQVKQEQQARNNSSLLFRLGDEWLAIDSLCVNEITRMRPIHSLPHRDSQLVKGLVNVRGELKLCVSLGAVLKLEKARESYFTDHEILERMLFVEKDDESYVFPVSEVHGSYRYTNNDIKSPPATVANARSNFTSGVILWNDQHVGILDHELLFYALGKSLR
jgi:chemotaxis-related protein WspD